MFAVSPPPTFFTVDSGSLAIFTCLYSVPGCLIHVARTFASANAFLRRSVFSFSSEILFLHLSRRDASCSSSTNSGRTIRRLVFVLSRSTASVHVAAWS